MTTNRLLISFSGGRTSGQMAWLLKKDAGYGEIKTVFANTGQEDERTLEFVHRCDKEWGLNLVWVEAVVNPQKRKGTTHRVVSFETATRDPSLFERMIEKYGIPNKNYPHCTRELKLQPITHYLRSIGWSKGSYDTAIGIRADELDRVIPDYRERNIIYPLMDLKIRKEDVFKFWDKQPFDLAAPEHRGNCVWCWKKSLRKHLTLAQENPELYDFPKRMEKDHAITNATDGKPRVFFRERKTAVDILELASKGDFEKFVDKRLLDVAGSCSESCELINEDTDYNNTTNVEEEDFTVERTNFEAHTSY